MCLTPLKCIRTNDTHDKQYYEYDNFCKKRRVHSEPGSGEIKTRMKNKTTHRNIDRPGAANLERITGLDIFLKKAERA